MTHALIQILCAAIGTLGFAIFFRVRPAHLPMATLGGIIAWTVYLLAHLKWDVFFSSLVAAFITCLWAEAIARIRKAPANIFLIPGVIPLLPGSALYYTMEGVVYNDMSIFVNKGLETLYITIGIVGGILFASEIVRILTNERFLTAWIPKRMTKKGK